MVKNCRFLITCEHGGNKIPDDYVKYFKNKKRILKTHLGYDPGALETAQLIARKCKCPIVNETVSRLLVDQNRSKFNRHIFSNISSVFPESVRNSILQTIYDPYHKKVLSRIAKNARESILTCHFSIHSFTPVLNNTIRNADFGLLYDPSRLIERRVVTILTGSIREKIPELIIRKNYPYKGVSDGLTSAMRKVFDQSLYCGIELEINQKHLFENNHIWVSLQKYLPICIKNVSFV